MALTISEFLPIKESRTESDAQERTKSILADLLITETDEKRN